MNREQLARKVALKYNKKYSWARPIVDSFFTTLEDALVEGEKVVLTGFGTFYVTKSKPFTVTSLGKNPIQVDDAVKVHFRAGRYLKNAINNRNQ